MLSIYYLLSLQTKAERKVKDKEHLKLRYLVQEGPNKCKYSLQK